MTKLLGKIKALATDPAATNGERQAAVEALKRHGVSLDITVSSEQVTLIPLAMVTPTKECIYAPSRIMQPMTISRSQLPKKTIKMLVSLAEDGKSNARKMSCYVGNGGYWLVSQ